MRREHEGRSIPFARLQRRRRAARREGFALIAALALLVILGSTGAVMVRMAGLQQSGASGAILGARASWAARSGIDWALHEAVAAGGCPAASTTLSLGEGALVGFDVLVTCTASTHREGSEDRTSLVIESVATFGAVGSRDFVFREVQASVVL